MNKLPVVLEEGLFLDQSVLSSINELSTELDKTLATKQIFRTDTEARVSVLDDIHFPTKAAKYWQSVREQAVMLEQLIGLSFEYRRNEVKIKRAQLAIKNAPDELTAEEAQIDLDQAQYAKRNLQQTAADRAREIKMWSKIKHELDDGSFDNENVNTHQLVSYATRFALQVAHTNMAQLSVGEANNLFGQLQTSLKRCQEQGVLDQVFAGLPQPIVAHLKQDLRLEDKQG